MIAKLLPLIFLVIGTGGGIGAGYYLEKNADNSTNAPDMETEKTVKMPEDDANSATEFVKMSNQFVVPVVEDDSIAALVVVSLSLEVRAGISEAIYAREPKLRDAFLRVLFDHANMGGFRGAFTRAEMMDLLRTALREVARKVIGPDVLDVLIVDIIRQDT